MVEGSFRIPDHGPPHPAAWHHAVWHHPHPRRFVERCEAPACEPLPCGPAPTSAGPEAAPRVSFASYLERQNLEDRLELSPEASQAPDRSRSSCRDAPGDAGDRPGSESRPAAARLGDVLPVATPPRRVEVETAYRLRVATTRPSGVLDVMG